MEGQQHTSKKVRNSKQMKIDRLSKLPDHITYHILSLMDTKYAVRTCVLSKKWKHHWTCIHSLNFDFQTFTKSWCSFTSFVLHVLLRRDSVKLLRLKFQCGGKTDPFLLNAVFYHAKARSVEVLETDLHLVYFLPSFFECQTLTTLNLISINIANLPSSFRNFVSLTTLQLSGVKLSGESYINDILSSCLNLENLVLVDCYCHTSNVKMFMIHSQQLLQLTISNIRYYGHDVANNLKLVLALYTPRLKLFEFSSMYPPVLLSMLNCTTLDKVNIRIIPPLINRERTSEWKKNYILDLVGFAKDGVSNAKSVTASLNFSKGYIMYHRTHDAETSLVELKQVSEDECMFGMAALGAFSTNRDKLSIS